MRKLSILFIALLLLTNYSYSQPTMSLSSITGATAGDTISIYLTGANLTDLASFQIMFTYDNTVIYHISTSSISPIIDSGFWVDIVIPGSIPLDTLKLAWFSLTPLNIIFDTLFEFTFIYLGGTTNLTFIPTPGVTFNNGMVSSFGVGINTAHSTAPSLEVYPNPAVNAELHLLCKGLEGSYKLELFSLDGKLLQSQFMTLYSPDQQIDLILNDLPGMYILRVSGEGGVFTRKFILQ